ncbi:MAG: transporter [Ruminococcus sp.]|nr:transporter [Ruminococcus sp.]
MKKSKRLISLINLNILLLVYSLSSVCSKIASQHEFMSLKFIFWYGLVILILGLYAIFWQQIIKHLPLNTAYANKAVTIVWGILWGMLFFKEVITWNMIIGAVVVIVGVILVVMADE